MTLNDLERAVVCRLKWFFVASLRTKTCGTVCKSFGMYECLLATRVGIGRTLAISSRSFWTNVEDGNIFSDAISINSPGSWRVVPYTSSAEQHWRSSFMVVQIPSMIEGRSKFQWVGWDLAVSEFFNCRWKRSTKPFEHGWYAVVVMWWQPKSLVNLEKSDD